MLDPFRQHKTLNINFFVHDPLTGEAYSRDPRNVARKAEDYLKGTGIADTVYFGPEAEFYIFDDVRFETQRSTPATTTSTPIEGAWNTGRKASDGGNLGYKPRYKGGYFPVPPMDHFTDLRSEMVRKLIECRHRRRDAAPRGRHGRPGRDRLQVRHAAEDGRQPDALQVRRQEHVARQYGHTVTFMPKPIFGDNGSGMHCHQSLWKDGAPLFYDEVGYAGLSDTARYYIGGLLKHAPSLLAFTNPTVNSYHRLVPGYEAPVNLVYSQRNRSACVRIPITGLQPEGQAHRVPRAGPVLQPVPRVLRHADGRPRRHPQQDRAAGAGRQGPLRAAARGGPPASRRCPARWTEVLDALEADHDYLLEGGVFTPDLIETWIAYKRENEVDPIRLRPHPHEFELYYDI